jgi:heme A synthase
MRGVVDMVLSKLAKFAWGMLVYNLFVIVFGAFVRATGSGAGCGSHWPLCNGVIIQRAPALETVIEYSHRLTSGIALVLVAGLIVLVWRSYPKGSSLRKSSGFAGLFIITESLLGAGLVLFELVQHDASLTRAISMMAHLLNTFLLLASLIITAWWLSADIPVEWKRDNKARAMSILGVLGMFVLAASGAITALGDTLFPAGSLAEGLQQDIDPAAHFLLRLRIFHPIIAVIVGAYVAGFGLWLRASRQDSTLSVISWSLAGLVGLQLVLGIMNVLLLAPVWLQLVHLLVSSLIWLCYVMVTVFAWITPDLTAGVRENNIDDLVNQAASQ